MILINLIAGTGMSSAEIAGASDLAAMMSQQGQHAEAAELLEGIHERAQLDVPARLRFAASLFRAERYADAGAVYEELLAESRNSPLALFNLAQTTYRQGRRNESSRLHREVLEKFEKALPNIAARSVFMLDHVLN